MRKLFYIFYFLFFTFYTFSQTSVIYTNTKNTIASNIEELPNNNFISCQQYLSNITYLNNVKITIVNENGIVQDSLIFEKINNSYNIAVNTIKFINNNIYLLLKETDYTDTTKHFLSLSCFNLNLDTIWNKKYFVDTTSIYGNTFCKTNDGGFAISGNIYINEKNTAFILKTDSVGETQWYKEYGNSNKNEAITKIIQTKNNNYILSGYNFVDMDHEKWYLIRTDSLGNLVWDWTINNPYNSNGGEIYDLIETQDSNFIAIGCQVYDDDVPGFGTVTNAHLIKFDINKNILSDKAYYEPLRIEQKPTDTTFSVFDRIVEKANGNFLVIGTRQYAVNMDFTESQTLLYELNPNLNVIRKIKYTPYLFHGTSPVGLINCNDGSLAFISNVNNFYPNTPNQRVWFVKTDTNYCDGLGACDTTMNIFIYSADTVSKTDTLDFKFLITSGIDIPYEVWLGFYRKNYSYCCEGEVVHNVNINTINSIKINYAQLVEQNLNASIPIGDTLYIRATIWPSSGTGRAEYCRDELFTLIFYTPDSSDGIKQLHNPEARISVYPNPAKTSISVMFTNLTNITDNELIIYDVYGKIVKKELLYTKQKTINIDISKFKNGVYFIKIGSNVGKFVKL